MKRLSISGLIFCTLVTATIVGCFSTNKVSVQNLSTQYRTDLHYLHPEFSLYHVNDSLSLLYFKIDESELLYIRRNMADSFSAAVKIVCKVTESYDQDMLKDTCSVVLNFASATNTKREYTVGSLPVKIKAGTTHLVTINTTDLISRKTDCCPLV